ncbi:MAG TPA: C25 family cysteine peptidase [bacterium]
MKRFIIFFIGMGLVFSQDIGARYLVITHDNFYNAVLPLAQWKNKKGMRAKVVKLSETGSSAAQIRSYIMNAYSSWQIPPEYVLLVGAGNYLPYPTVSGTYSDNYYTNMDGDIYNEILSGRLTVHSDAEAQNVVNKILLYERTPDLTDTSWLIDACLIVRDDYETYSDSIYWSDVRHARSLMRAAGYRNIDTLNRRSGNNTTDVINRVNEGRAFVVYRGQGVNNWWDPFSVNPSLTANGARLPIVLSFTCSTLGTGGTPAGAEMWFLTGTAANPKGASGYFATTTVISHQAYLRSAVCVGFFDALFADRKTTFGEACEQGRQYVYQQYSSSSEYYGFNTIGDPEMNVWTAMPRLITVTHDSILYAGIQDTLTVTVQQADSFLKSAPVCIVMDTIVYQVGHTDSMGTVSFALAIPYPGMLDLTVIGKNLNPYEAQIPVSGGSAYLAYDGCAVEDSLGDDDGLVDPAEIIMLGVSITNLGIDAATGVKATLSTADSFTIMSDSVSYYGDVPADSVAVGLNPFVFALRPDAVAHAIRFALAINDDSGHVWNDSFSVLTTGSNSSTGPDLYGYYIYDDTDTLTGNAPVYDWLEIATAAGGPGMIVSEITDEDADTVTVPLPFDFPYYSITYNTIGLCSNGFAELGYSTHRFGMNTPIPSPAAPSRFLSGFWDDLNPGANGDIYQYYDSTAHRWILEYYQCSHYDSVNNLETFQIICRDPVYHPTPTGDGEILFLYNHVADATSNSVGIEDETQMRGLEYVYNGSYDQNAAALIDSRALLITTKPPFEPLNPWLYLVSAVVDDSLGGNNNGIFEPGETLAVTVSVGNDGNDNVFGTLGTIRTSSSSAVITDSLADFGDIFVDSTAANTIEPYGVIIDSNPTDTIIGFTVNFEGNSGAYQGQVYFTMFIHSSTGIDELGIRGVGKTMLSVAPNPSSGNMLIKFQIKNSNPPHSMADQMNAQSPMLLKIYDAAGRLIKSFNLPATDYLLPASIQWDGTDEIGRNVPAGVYFVRLETGEEKWTEKAVLLR